MNIKKHGKAYFLAGAAIALGVALAGCGGGGGGGASATTTTAAPTQVTSKSVDVSGTATGTIPAAGREAGREADALANKSVIAYVLGDGNRRLLNSSSDVTDASGNFSLKLNLGSVSSANVVIEILSNAAGDASNVKVALEALSASKTGVTADDTSSAEAALWAQNTSEGLADTIKPVIAILSSDAMSQVRTKITTSDKGAQFVSVMKGAATSCSSKTGAEKQSCIVDKIEEKIATVTDTTIAALINEVEVDCIETKVNSNLSSATPADKLKILAPSETLESIKNILAMYDESQPYSADLNIEKINLADEAQELLKQAAPAIAAYKAGGSSRSVEVKKQLLGIINATDFTTSDAETFLINMKGAYASKIATDSTANTTRITSGDMISLISGYDIIMGALVQVFVEDGKVTRDTAVSMTEGLIYSLTKLGNASENNTSIQTIFDDWVTAYAQTEFRGKFHAFLDPLGMSDRTKTEHLMELIRDLSYTDGTREAVLTKLNQYKASGYLNQATVDYIMTLYDKYYGHFSCPINTSNLANITIGGPDCITQAELVHLFELHFDKKLPVFDAVLTGLNDWIHDSNNLSKLIAIGTSYKVIEKIYPAMKSSATEKEAYGALLDSAGINKELFWLAMNLEPYVTTQ